MRSILPNDRYADVTREQIVWQNIRSFFRRTHRTISADDDTTREQLDARMRSNSMPRTGNANAYADRRARGERWS